MKSKNSIKVNVELEMMEYIDLVEELANEYFNENGDYQPHIGTLNAIRLFYNYCVVESDFNVPDEIIEPEDMTEIIKDEKFMWAFNDAIIGTPGIKLDFANAYDNALAIVHNKKSSSEHFITPLKNALIGLSENLNPLLSDENLKTISNIAKNISNGDISADAIVEAYGKSERFKEILNSGIKDKEE